MSAGVQTFPVKRFSAPRFGADSLLWLLLLFAALKVAVQAGITLLSLHAGYGIFRDELYYLVCGRHLAFGYVDQPPLVALQARASELVFGYRHLALFRVPSYLAGALTVALTGLLADALGGSRRAAALAMLAVTFAPVYLATQSFLSMNSWDPALWTAVMLALARLLATPWVARWWVMLGVSAGLAFENKASAVFLIAALLLGLLLTPARALFRQRGFALAAALCALLALPNLVWQGLHGFPTWQWLHAVSHSTKDVVLSPPQFLVEQAFMLSPLHLMVWLGGLVWLLQARESRPWRALGVLYLAFLAIMLLLHAKDYYLAPVYPVLFAAGAVFWTHWAGRSPARSRLMWGYAAFMTLFIPVTLPFAVPILSPDAFTRYSRLLGFKLVDSEQHPGAAFPEFFADHLGWQELADGVGRVYRALPAEERGRTGIAAGNYGEASAVEIYGRGLPPVISSHQNFWLWGPRGYSGREMIVVTDQPMPVLLKSYGSCTLKEAQRSPYQMPWEQRGIYLCRDRVRPYAEDWAALKLYW